MAADPKTTIYRPGMRVRWGCGETAVGTLLDLARDEDTGGILLCGGEECGNRPLWRIRFDSGRLKKYCCEGSIVEVCTDAG